MSSTFLTADNEYMYQSIESDFFISNVERLKKQNHPNIEYLKSIAAKTDDTGNPIIIKVRLKKI